MTFYQDRQLYPSANDDKLPGGVGDDVRMLGNDHFVYSRSEFTADRRRIDGDFDKSCHYNTLQLTASTREIASLSLSKSGSPSKYTTSPITGPHSRGIWG